MEASELGYDWIGILDRLPNPCTYKERYQNLCAVKCDLGHYSYEGLGYYGEHPLDPDDIRWNIICDESRILGYTREVTHYLPLPY